VHCHQCIDTAHGAH